MHPLRVGIVAPCSVVPQVEFSVGRDHLRSLGFDVRVHEQVAGQHFTFAGSDAERASAFFQYASDPTLDVLWSARGGYGASRLLSTLDRLTAEFGKPKKKLLVGYSDVTVLHEYVRRNWGWSTLHCPMPAATNFATLGDPEWRNILALVRGQHVDFPATDAPLKPLTHTPTTPIRADLIGGNLSLWAVLIGTKHPPTPAAHKILFLEDIGEAFYRLDRMMTQLANSGYLHNAAAVVLGDFTDCADAPDTCLAPCDSPDALARAMADPKNAPRQPLRPTYTYDQAIDHIFTSLCRPLNIPLYQGLPVGHGPHFHPLPLGATYELTPDHRLKLVSWDWTATTPA